METFTREIEICEFTSLIPQYNADMLAPVRIYPRRLLLREQMPEVEGVWLEGTETALKSYSMTRGPAGALGLFIAHYGNPTDEQRGAYVDDVREQLEEHASAGLGTFDELALDLRGRIGRTLHKAVFVSRVFPGELPQVVFSYATDTKSHAESGELVLPQRYHLVHAANGEVQYFAFSIPEEYDPESPGLALFIPDLCL